MKRPAAPAAAVAAGPMPPPQQQQRRGAAPAFPAFPAFVAKFAERAGAVHTAQDQRRNRDAAAARDGAALRRALGPFAMLNLGIGAVVGSGIFVLTGVVARDVAGPAVVLSYAAAAVAALLSALAYAQMAVAFPSAGGAFAFASGTFGELVAFGVGADLTLEYALSAAAVARGLTAYAAALFGRPASALRFATALPAVSVDPLACASVLALCALLALGARESAWANTLANTVNVVLILFVVALGLTMFAPANLVPFAPFGARGVVTGAGVVFFSFVGADSVANAAEECAQPARDLPVGIVGGIGAAAVLYLLMSLTLVGMQPSGAIDRDAPFSAAFAAAGKEWAGGVVAAGALAGIATSIFVSLYSQTRLLFVLGRARLLPPVFGRVSARTRTPVAATAATAAAAGLLALLLDIELLAELVSLGTLACYTLVCLAVLVHRYDDVGEGRRGPSVAPWVAVRLALLVALSLAAAVSFHRSAPAAAPLALAGLWTATALSFYMLEPERRAKAALAAAAAAGALPPPPTTTPPTTTPPARRDFQMPLQPILPCLGVAANSFLLGSLGWQAYLRFGVWMSMTALVYVSYSMWHSGGEAADEGGGGGGAEGGTGGRARGRGDGGGGGSSSGGAVELSVVPADRRRSADPLLMGEGGARQPSSSGGGAGPSGRGGGAGPDSTLD